MADSAGEGLVVRSRPTREERVSRIGPVELFRSRERIVTFIGTDVSRTAGPELHGKIVQRSTKDQSRPEVAISLPPDALVKLLETLTSIDAVREAGTVVVVPADTETPLGLLKDVVEKLVAKPEILRGLDADALTKIDSGLHQMRRLATMREALAQLDDLLESGVIAESRYQAWCARNGWAFGIEYDSPDEIRSIAAEDHADMLLPRLTGYRDVIELKRPDASPIAEDKDRGTWYWTNAASGDIAGPALHREVGEGSGARTRGRPTNRGAARRAVGSQERRRQTDGPRFKSLNDYLIFYERGLFSGVRRPGRERGDEIARSIMEAANAWWK